MLLELQRIAAFRDSIAAAYSNVLAIEVDGSYIDNMLCGGSWVQDIALSQQHTTSLAPNSSIIPATTAPFRPLPTTRKLQSASMALATPANHTNDPAVEPPTQDTTSNTPSIAASTAGFNNKLPETRFFQTPATISNEEPPPTSYLNTVQILLTMSLPGPILNKYNTNRVDISKAVTTTSDSILRGSMKRFFGVPIISIRAVAIKAGTSVYGIEPSANSSTADAGPDPASASAASTDAAAAAPAAPASVLVDKESIAAEADHSGSISKSASDAGRDTDVLGTEQLPLQQPVKYAAPVPVPQQQSPAVIAAQPASKAPEAAAPSPLATFVATTPAEAKPQPVSVPPQQQQAAVAPKTFETEAKPQPVIAAQQQQQHQTAVVLSKFVQTFENPPTVSSSAAPVGSNSAAATPEAALEQAADTVQGVQAGQLANGTADSPVTAPGAATGAAQPLGAVTSGGNGKQNTSTNTTDSMNGPTWRPPSESEAMLSAAGVYFPYGSFNLADYDQTPSCDFAPTAGNTLADKLGRLWSYMDGKECVFRAPRDAALLRSGSSAILDSNSQYIAVSKDNGGRSGGTQGASALSGSALTWESAPVCDAKPIILNSVVDSEGNLWGWENEKSCAFRGFQVRSTATYDTLPTNEPNNTKGPANDSGSIARMRRVGPMSQPGVAGHAAGRGNPLADWLKSVAAVTQHVPSKAVNSLADLKQRSPNRVDTVWENAVTCNAAPTKNNIVPDRFGRLWGWVEGKVCAFKNAGKPQS